MKISLLGFPVLLMAALTAACSGADQNGSNNGGKGGEGGSNTGASGGGDTGGGDTGGGNQGGSGAGNQGGNGGGTGGNGGNGGGNTGGSGGGGGGGSTGGPCGGKSGGSCTGDEYCDFPDDLCGAADGAGTCTPKPDACPDVYDPVCSCDGMVYSNACDAAAVGLDVSLLGTCPNPVGQFPCGSGFCVEGQDYCQIQISDVAGIPDSYSCGELPPGCMLADATCACLSDLPCGDVCEQDGKNFTLTCPGG